MHEDPSDHKHTPMSCHVKAMNRKEEEEVRYLGGCRLACQRMREGTLMAPNCAKKKEKKKKEEILKIGVCAACAVCEVLRTYVRVRACMCVCGKYVPVECVSVH